MTRLDSYDHHRRKRGEEDKEGIRHQEQEPNDIDKKTRLTTSTTSSITDHILSSAISHGSRATTTCLWVIDDIITSILDYLDSSRSSNGKQQHINIKQQRQTDDNHIKKNDWLNIKEPHTCTSRSSRTTTSRPW